MKKINNNVADAELIQTLQNLRWGNSTVCPHCNSEKIIEYVVENKFQCEHCFRSFSVVSKTEFENTKLPLSTWLLAYYLIKENKSTDSANFTKWLNVTQKTSTTIQEKINKIIAEKNWFNKITESTIYQKRFTF